MALRDRLLSRSVIITKYGIVSRKIHEGLSTVDIIYYKNKKQTLL